jgi:hypothetical protein
MGGGGGSEVVRDMECWCDVGIVDDRSCRVSAKVNNGSLYFAPTFTSTTPHTFYSLILFRTSAHYLRAAH